MAYPMNCFAAPGRPKNASKSFQSLAITAGANLSTCLTLGFFRSSISIVISGARCGASGLNTSGEYK